MRWTVLHNHDHLPNYNQGSGGVGIPNVNSHHKHILTQILLVDSFNGLVLLVHLDLKALIALACSASSRAAVRHNLSQCVIRME